MNDCILTDEVLSLYRCTTNVRSSFPISRTSVLEVSTCTVLAVLPRANRSTFVVSYLRGGTRMRTSNTM